MVGEAWGISKNWAITDLPSVSRTAATIRSGFGHDELLEVRRVGLRHLAVRDAEDGRVEEVEARFRDPRRDLAAEAAEEMPSCTTTA